MMCLCAVMSAMSGIQTVDPSISNGTPTSAAYHCKLWAFASPQSKYVQYNKPSVAM